MIRPKNWQRKVAIEAMTGQALCQEAQARLEAAGITSAARDVMVLFRHCLSMVAGKPVLAHHMPEHLSGAVPPAVQDCFASAIERRVQRQPVSHITGKRAFWTHELIVTPDVLDPRPDTETLIEAALRLPWKDVLDLGTGSGAIILSLLSERPDARAVATDISLAALEVARRNAAQAGLPVRFLHSDWFAGVEGRFDLIVSNPPYIAAAEMAGLEPEVREWEPRNALTDEADGLQAYREICRRTGDFLNEGGFLLVEIGESQGPDVSELMRSGGFSDISIIIDLNGKNRAVQGTYIRH